MGGRKFVLVESQAAIVGVKLLYSTRKKKSIRK